MSDPFHAVVAAGILPSEEQHRALLDSIVTAAQAIFRAQAASIFLHDEDTDELVFEAVAGRERRCARSARGSRRAPGSPAGSATRQPLVLEDLGNDPRFARDVAEKTGYVPRALMAVPLLHDERALGVLQVLDRDEGARTTLADMDLLGLFASQAAIALDLLRGARRAKAVVEGGAVDVAIVAGRRRARGRGRGTAGGGAEAAALPRRGARPDLDGRSS